MVEVAKARAVGLQHLQTDNTGLQHGRAVTSGDKLDRADLTLSLGEGQLVGLARRVDETLPDVASQAHLDLAVSTRV